MNSASDRLKEIMETYMPRKTTTTIGNPYQPKPLSAKDFEIQTNGDFGYMGRELYDQIKAMRTLEEAKKPQVSTVNVTHEEIMEGFDAETQKILLEANQILGGGKASPNTLSSLGFVNHVEKKPLTMTESEADMIIYYKHRYPYKFITHKGIMAVCEKYGLVYSGPEHFIGDIPAENQRDLENFHVSPRDKSSDGNEGIIIVGTRDQFKSTGFTVVNNKVVPDLKGDPAVFYPVKGGYLLMTAWGPEAELPEFQNPTDDN